jgi:hypothetical protein
LPKSIATVSASMHHGYHGAPSGRDLPYRGPGRTCRPAARPGRLARLGQTRCARQYHSAALAADPKGSAAKSPELNPVENIWEFMRDNWLSNRVFKSYADIVDHCCHAWNKLVEQPWTIMSIGLRRWAHQF